MTQYSKPEPYKKPETSISSVDNTGSVTPAEPQPRKPLPVIDYKRVNLKGNSSFI